MSHSPGRGGVLRAAAITAVSLIGIACDGPMGPERLTFGDISVGATATGLDQLLVFTVQVDSSMSQPAAVGANAIFHALTAGSHRLKIDGVPDNCTLDGQNPRVIEVSAEVLTPITLAFTCVARNGIVQVTITSKGIDSPGVYAIQVDGGTARPVPGNGTADLEVAGSRVLKLVGLSANCTPDDGVERAVTVQTGTMTRDTVQVSFDVTCIAVNGLIEITSATTGDDPDPTGYLVQVDTKPPFRINVSGVTTVLVGGGTHILTLSDLSSNCALQGSSTRTVAVTIGGTTRDTVRARFEASCTPAEKIVFARWTSDYYYSSSEVFLVYADGSEVTRLAGGSRPSWSPDGKRVAYAQTFCDWYYYNSCSSSGLGIVNGDGTDAHILTRGNDDEPRWSPDGSRVAFVRSGQLWIVNADGATEKRIAMDGVGDIQSPAWSPNGKLLAFGCAVVSSWRDICVVNADGSGFLRLTSDPWLDSSPTWSADGTRLAFSTNRDDTNGEDHIATIRPDGTGFLKLMAGYGPVWSPGNNRIAFTTGSAGASGSHDVVSMNPDGSDIVRVPFGSLPAWSRDGTKMVFIGAGTAGLQIVNVNGTGRAQLTNGNDDAPAWRP